MKILRVILRGSLIGLIGTCQPLQVLAADPGDVFQFFQEEAKVVSASHQPVPLAQAPATVYVVTAEDIKNSGAQTIWDALRNVPGVDVVQTRTDQGEISIRGLDKPFSNRTLILLDGKTVLDPFFDFTVQEAILVTMQEIDRIEVVEGPASAVYGANAVNGVINIITKTPEKMQGGLLSYTGGERNTQIGSFDYGRKVDQWSYKFGGGWRSMNQFADADEFASQAGKFNAFFENKLSPDSEWSASGGVSDLNTQTSGGVVGPFFDKGISSFARTDYRYEKTKVWGFWNHYRTTLDEFAALGNATLDSDSYNAEAQQAVSLPFRNELVLGNQLSPQRGALHGPGARDADAGPVVRLRGGQVGHGRPLVSHRQRPRGSPPLHPDHVLPARESRVYAGAGTSVPRVSGDFFPQSDATGKFDSQHHRHAECGDRITESSVRFDPNPHHRESRSFARTHADRRGRSQRLVWTSRDHSDSDSITRSNRISKPVRFCRQGCQLLRPPCCKRPTSIRGISAPGAAKPGMKLCLNSWLSSFANYSYQDLRDSPGDQIFALQSRAIKPTPDCWRSRGAHGKFLDQLGG